MCAFRQEEYRKRNFVLLQGKRAEEQACGTGSLLKPACPKNSPCFVICVRNAVYCVMSCLQDLWIIPQYPLFLGSASEIPWPLASADERLRWDPEPEGLGDDASGHGL